MPDRPEILMPVTPAGAVEQMMLEELRRSREASDRMFGAISKVETELALLRADNARSIADRAKSDATLSDHADRLGQLETWRARQDGATGFVGWIINSPIIGWLAAAGVGFWALISGKHP